MKGFVLFCFVSFCFIKKHTAQNLVPNSSFEVYFNCTNFYVNNASDWKMLNNGATAGVLLACQSDPYSRTPKQYLDNCFKSYQTVRTGVAYASFGVYTQSSSSQESGHPACKLMDTLEAGKIYCVTYYVSHWNNARYSLDKLGALLTPTPFPYYVTGTTSPTFSMAGLYTPQIISTPGIAYEDTLGWEEVSGSFTAVGNESYLTIGDFFLHSQHYIKDSYPTNCNGLAEYYVDDVSVEVVEIAKAKNDTLIYQGDSVLVGANNSEAALFNWQPTAGLSSTNCPNPKASPTVNTTYTVTKTQCKSVTTDVITVSVSPVGINEISINNSITLQPNPTNELINISSRFEMQKIEVTNIAGQFLLSETATEKTHQLQLQSFSEGIYFIKIILVNGMTVTKKIIKQ
jgi:hypothetical protein